MDPNDWLVQHAPGFDELSDAERQAIFHFALLWSFFEARALNTRASSSAILELAHRWYADGQLEAEAFAGSLNYFRQRYFSGGEATGHFGGLGLRQNDSPELVREVLKGRNTNVADCVAALLIVVYRLRNNLFHGVKWADRIRGQLNNFTHANSVLMSALNLVGPL